MAKSKQTETFLTDAEESALSSQVEKAVGSTTAVEPKKSSRSLNPELQAMAKIDRLLAELPFPAHARVINWLQSRAMEAEQVEREKEHRSFVIRTDSDDGG